MLFLNCYLLFIVFMIVAFILNRNFTCYFINPIIFAILSDFKFKLFFNPTNLFYSIIKHHYFDLEF